MDPTFAGGKDQAEAADDSPFLYDLGFGSQAEGEEVVAESEISELIETPAEEPVVQDVAGAGQAYTDDLKKDKGDEANRPTGGRGGQYKGPADAGGPQSGSGAAAAPGAGKPASSQVAKQEAHAVAYGRGQVARAGGAAAPPAVAPAEVERLKAMGYLGGGDADEAARPRRSDVLAPPLVPQTTPGTESYAAITDNPFKSPMQDPLSTFSIDVDSGAYANVRRFLNAGQLPPADAVRIEELINYFDYDDSPPTDGEAPFAVHLDVGPSPWADQHRLVRIGLKGMEVEDAERPPANLVFLIDVSGSMNNPAKLPLLKTAMQMMVEALDERDRVAIVTYAGNARVALPSTSCDQRATILAALSGLHSGGSTNGGAGIQQAYDMATSHFIPGGVNRVVLATDGDFNVGITDKGSLEGLITDRARTGVFLSVLGFGTGNLKDSTMEKLAQYKGNGNYAYVDSAQRSAGKRARRAEMGGTLLARGQGREDPGRVQPREGRQLPVDRLREPHPGRPRLQRRHQGCR